MTLAGYIKTITPSTGDAWLVNATQVDGTKTMQVVYTLYTDSHAIYYGQQREGHQARDRPSPGPDERRRLRSAPQGGRRRGGQQPQNPLTHIIMAQKAIMKSYQIK